MGLAGTSHINYPEIRPSGSLNNRRKLHTHASQGEVDGSKRLNLEI
jgi:hypothetical protein